MWGSEQMQLLLCFCTMLTTWSGSTFLRIPFPVWFWVRLYHKEICMRFGKQWSEGTAMPYAHLWLICSLPNLVWGDRWASGPSSSHHISSLASPRAGPVACIFLGEASSFFGRSPTLSGSEVATHRCEFQFVYMGSNFFLQILACPHSFLLLWSFFPSWSYWNTEMISPPPDSQAVHKQSLLHVFTNTHNRTHSYPLFHIAQSSSTLSWVTTLTDTRDFSLLHVGVEDILFPSTLRNFSERKWIPYGSRF